MTKLSAAEFKTHCLKVMDRVRRNRQAVLITITKRGVPVAKLVPVDLPERRLVGALEGKMRAVGEIVSPAIPRTDWSEPLKEWDELHG